MKPIGGEIHCWPDAGCFSYLTDSGRSSLRLILQSGFADRRFLLPDFLCGVIPKVFDELGVRYAYYRVKPDLTIDAGSVASQAYDVLYVINYFGSRQDYRGMAQDGRWIVEDSVFLPVVDPPPAAKNWIGFNSLRKISHLADGSLVKSTIPLSRNLVSAEPAPFAALKYAAKRMKAEHLETGAHSESDYLARFDEGERCVDAQTRIHAVSEASLGFLLEFYRTLSDEYRVRARNYDAAERCLGRFGVRLAPAYPCLYVLNVPRRSELREYLRTQRIYLPVHWPNATGVRNDLYDTIISVPVDSRYDEQDMARIGAGIEAFYAAAGAAPAA